MSARPMKGIPHCVSARTGPQRIRTSFPESFRNRPISTSRRYSMPLSVECRTIGGRPTPGRSVGRRAIHSRCSRSSRYRMTVVGECPVALISSVVVCAPYVAADRMFSAMSSFMLVCLQCVVRVWLVSLGSFMVLLSAFGALLGPFCALQIAELIYYTFVYEITPSIQAGFIDISSATLGGVATAAVLPGGGGGQRRWRRGPWHR